VLFVGIKRLPACSALSFPLLPNVTFVQHHTHIYSFFIMGKLSVGTIRRNTLSTPSDRKIQIFAYSDNCSRNLPINSYVSCLLAARTSLSSALTLASVPDVAPWSAQNTYDVWSRYGLLSSASFITKLTYNNINRIKTIKSNIYLKGYFLNV